MYEVINLLFLGLSLWAMIFAITALDDDIRDINRRIDNLTGSVWEKT